MTNNELTASDLALLPFPKKVIDLTKTSSADTINIFFKNKRRKAVLSWKDALASGLFKGASIQHIKTAQSSMEGYALAVALKEGHACSLLIADKPRALQYAQNTLEQIVRLNSRQHLPECLLVVDWPDVPIRVANRTLMCTRDTEKTWYFEQGLNNADDIFKRMVELKLNTFAVCSGWGEGLKVLINKQGRRTPVMNRLVKSARMHQLDLALILVHDIECDCTISDYTKGYPCCSSEKRRQRLRQAFEQLVRAYPEIKYWILHNQEHSRCKCPKCRKKSFGDEVISCWRDYYRILRRLRPEAVFICCPYYQLGFPKFHMRWIKGRWKEVGPDIRTCWWTDNYPLRNLPQPLLNVEETFEPYSFDKLPHVWHWFYMNGWIDFTFPCPEHFRSWIRRGLKSGHVECFMGEQAFYKSSEWNIRALAQFSWNSRLSTADFDTLILNTAFRTKSVGSGRSHIEQYRHILTDFLIALFQKGHAWKEEQTPEVIRIFKTLLKEIAPLEVSFRKILLPARNKPVDLTRDFLLDLAILRHEIKMRLLIRESYLAWQSAERLYDHADREKGNAEFNRALVMVRSAQSAWFKLRKNRMARGNYSDRVCRAVNSKMEPVFPDLILTLTLTRQMRSQGYHGYRPRFKEWLEIDKLWEGYACFQ